MAQLTQWLELMIDEIARKRDAQRRDEEEVARRVSEAPATPAPQLAQAPKDKRRSRTA